MLQVLREGSSGPMVTLWQTFLRGQGYYTCPIDGDFGAVTKQAVIDFQRVNGLDSDGVIGQYTYSRGLKLGLSLVVDDQQDKAGSNWPAPPSFSPLTPAARTALFSDFQFVSAPAPGNPEAIQILGTWVRDNIEKAIVPQLAPFVVGGKVLFHKLAAPKLVSLFKAWEDAKLFDLVLSWEGGWAPRYVRGSRTYLSNHSWGTAFDINARWNGLGARPALLGEYGSVRQLVEIANGLGWYWGGHYSGRPDGMHFELVSVV